MTLIVPVFNECSRWDKYYWIEALAIPGINWIFVNDGSSDASQELLEELLTFENLVVINQGVNLGKAEAIRTGFNYYSANNEDHFQTEAIQRTLIGYIDADCAFSTAEIERFKKITVDDSLGLISNGFESVWSSRVLLKGHMIKRKKTRHYIGRLIATVLSFADPHIPYDSQSGFKIFVCTPDLIKIFHEKFKTKWFIDLEIAARYGAISGKRLRIWEEPLYFWKEIGGSALTLRSFPNIVLEVTRIFRILLRQPKESHHSESLL